MKEAIVKKLEEMGGDRWTKGVYDRIYFNAKALGIRFRTEKGSYIEKWESIEGVDMKAVNNVSWSIEEDYGFSLSHARCAQYCGIKSYIDINSGKPFAEYRDEIKEFLEARLAYLLKKAENEVPLDENEEAHEIKLTKEEIAKKVFEALRTDIYFDYCDKETKEYISPKKVEETIEKILISEDRKFAVVEATIFINKTGRLARKHFWHIVLRLNYESDMKVMYDYCYATFENRLDFFRGKNCSKAAEMFENTREWKELFVVKKSKKFNAEQAIDKIKLVRSAQKVKEILTLCKKDALKKLAKVSGVKIRSIYSRETLLRVLIENAEKFLECKNLDKRAAYVDSPMNSKQRSVRYSINLREPVQDFCWKMDFLTKQILIEIGAYFGVELSLKATKSEMIRNLISKLNAREAV